MRRSAISSVRRRASVGWAVRTGWTTSRTTPGLDRVPVRPTARRSTASPMDSSIGRPAGRARPRAERADALAFLGQVDELEVERERAGRGRRVVEVERRELRARAAPARCRARGRGRDAAPQGDRPPPDPLDQREQLGSRLLRDDLPEQRAEEADLVGERVARAAQPGSRGLGRRGRKPGPPRAGRGPSRSGSAVGHGDRMGEARFGCQRRGLRFDCKGTRAGTGPQPISVAVPPTLVR